MPLSKTMMARLDRLAPCNDKGQRVPKWVRCYDNGGETIDRYTVVYTRQNDGYSRGIGMSENPFHPQGVGMRFEYHRGELMRGQWQVDRPKSSHIGKSIPFASLPSACRKAVFQDYAEDRKLPLEELLESWKE